MWLHKRQRTHYDTLKRRYVWLKFLRYIYAVKKQLLELQTVHKKYVYTLQGNKSILHYSATDSICLTNNNILDIDGLFPCHAFMHWNTLRSCL